MRGNLSKRLCILPTRPQGRAFAPELIYTMSNRLLAILAAAVLVAAVAFSAAKSTYSETNPFDSYGSMEEYIEAVTDEDLDDIEEDLELELTEFYYSEDVHEAGTMNYDGLKRDECENSSLPRIDITLGEDYVLSKEYSSCDISMTNAGKYNVGKCPGQVRIRGNWTSKMKKKPLKIKFDTKISMFGRRAEKSWTLLANFMDNTQLHNYIAYDLYDFLTPDGQFVPLYRYVDVYINDTYIGVYALSDQIETGRGRIDIKDGHGSSPAETDYLIEQDFRLGKQEPEGENRYWFWSRYRDIMFSVKSPSKDQTTADLDYMRDYMDSVYVLAKLGRYDEVEKLIDVESFIRYMIVQDVTRNADVYKASIFYLKPAGGKLRVATIWDCDLTFGGLGGYPNGSVICDNYLYDAFMSMPEFRKQYLDTFFENDQLIRDHVNSEIDRVSDLYYDELSNEYFNWEYDNTEFMIPEMNGLESYRDQLDMMKWWFGEQMTNLEAQYINMY